jgi:hypothetical protein
LSSQYFALRSQVLARDAGLPGKGEFDGGHELFRFEPGGLHHLRLLGLHFPEKFRLFAIDFGARTAQVFFVLRDSGVGILQALFGGFACAFGQAKAFRKYFFQRPEIKVGRPFSTIPPKSCRVLSMY